MRVGGSKWFNLLWLLPICTYCMHDVRKALFARPLVHHVRMDSVAGCLQVDHDHDDPTVLTGLLRQSLRGWEIAGNGETIMISTTSKLSDGCSWHSSGDAGDAAGSESQGGRR